MEQNIFREKSLKRINSPEKLDEYLKVTSPSVWLILIGVIIVLIGFIVWGFYGKLNTTAHVGCIVSDSVAYCYTSEDNISTIKPKMELIINDKEYTITEVGQQGILIPEEYNYLRHVAGLDNENYAFPFSATCPLENGVYRGDVVLETISPIIFIFN